jgi:hypothetical protein
MKTRKFLLLCLAFGLFAASISSCKKAEKTIVNLWKLTSYSYDGATQSQDREYTFDIKKDGTYTTGPYLFADSPGTWALSDDNATLMLYTNTGYTHTINILKIKNKELWLQETSGTHSEEYHWEPK